MLTSVSLAVLSVVFCGVDEAAVTAPPATAAPPPHALEARADHETPGVRGTSLSTPLPARPRKRWYGWELAISDVAFLLLRDNTSATAGQVTAMAGIGLVSPVLHFANGNRVMGSVSLISRLALVGLLFATRPPPPIVTANGECRDDWCKTSLDDVLPSLMVSLLTVSFMVIDDTVMARVSETPSQPASDSTSVVRRPSAASSTWAPTIAPTRGGASVALLARF